MMKKLMTVLLVCLLLTALVLAGCQNPTETTGSTEDTQTATDASTETTQSALQDSIFDNAPEGGNKPVDTTPKPTETTPVSTTEPGGDTDATEPSKGQDADPTEMDYATFQAMSGAEQMAFQQSFGEGEEGLDAFFDWYNAAKEAYERENPPIEIGGDGVIDMDQILGGGQ